MIWVCTHLRMAEFGCLASMPIFSSTMPFAIDDPPSGLAFSAASEFALAYDFCAQRFTRRELRSLRAARIPAGLPLPIVERWKKKRMRNKR